MMLATNSSVSFRNDARKASSKGKRTGSGVAVSDVPQVQPLPGEVRDERFGSLVGQHALNLLLQHDRILQPAAFGEIEQLIVGNAAPQEKRQTRRELEVGDTVYVCFARLARRSFSGGGILFDAEQEIRRDEHRLEGTLNPASKSAWQASSLFIERKQRLNVGRSDRAPERAACERRENRLRARRFLFCGLRVAREDLRAARGDPAA